MPTEQELDLLRADILDVCQQTRAMSEIVAHAQIKPHIQKIGDQRVREIIRSLADAGLLFSRGETLGVVYHTTALGRENIQKYRNRKYLKPD